MLYLGKKAARPGSMKLSLSYYLKSADLPKLPMRFGNMSYWNNWQWGMLGNDTAGCCVWAGFAHQCMMWGASEGNMDVSFTAEQILGPKAYGETGYIEGDDSTDQGTDMAQACQFWKDNSFFGHTIRGFAEIDPSKVAMATFIFGSSGIGLKMTQAQMDQFDHNEPWDPVPDSQEIGGHYVPIIGRNAHGNFLCITWGRLQAITPAFIEDACDEAVCQLSDDWLNAQQETPRGLKLDDMVADMQSLSNS